MDLLPDELVYRVWYAIDNDDQMNIIDINHRTKSLSENDTFWYNKIESIWRNCPGNLREKSVPQLKCLYKSLSKSGKIYTFTEDNSNSGSKIITCLPGFNNVWQISWGENHAAFITNTGEIYTVEQTNYLQLGYPGKQDIVPSKIKGFDNIIQVSCGRKHTAFLTALGEVYTFGCNDYGQLGYPTLLSRSGTRKYKYSPTKILNLDNVKQISCGYDYTAFVTYRGELYTCGAGEYGQLGLGGNAGRGSPDKISLPGNIKVKQVSCGNHHTAFVTQSGEIYSFGDPTFGQLGINSNYNIKTPTLIPGFNNVVRVSCGGFHTAFITTEGKIYTFGANAHGQLGLGDTKTRNTPTPIPGYGEPDCPKIIQVSCGHLHTIFITDRGQVYTLGYDNTYRPSLITGFTKVHYVSAGTYYNAYISRD